jgi:hypothetical protein
MNGKLAQIEMVLARIERLAEQLPQDPDHHVLRSANELRAAFCARLAIEPAVARVRDGLDMLRGGNHAGTRREFKRRAHGVDHLEQVMAQELLPELRRVGFNV